MKQTKLIMGMPINLEVVDEGVTGKNLDEIWEWFRAVDARFSTYKSDSEISKINRGEIGLEKYSPEMKKIFKLAEETKNETSGYFDIKQQNFIDPSGIVKGWAIWEAAKKLIKQGWKNFYVDAGGDIQTYGQNSQGQSWRVGIRNPFKREENIKILSINNLGVATSGTAIRGEHIYNPVSPGKKSNIVSLTVIAKNIYEADRLATAAFAMGQEGIYFLESLSDVEAYMIDKEGVATVTSNFEKYVI
jgi:FAD:protein FMN transferase